MTGVFAGWSAGCRLRWGGRLAVCSLRILFFAILFHVRVLWCRYYRALLLDYANDDYYPAPTMLNEIEDPNSLAINLGKSPTDIIVQTTSFFGAT